MRQDGFFGRERAHDIGLIRHVVHRDTREIRAVTELHLWLEDEGRAPAPRAAEAAVGGGDGGGTGVGRVAVVELSQSFRQILGVHHPVGFVLKLLLPPVRRARRRADEEELASIGERQVDVLCRDGRLLPEIHPDLLAHQSLTLQLLAHLDGGLRIEEGYDDAPEGFEWRERVHGRSLRDELADHLEAVGAEDLERLKVCDDERVGGLRRLLQRWDLAEVEAERVHLVLALRERHWPCVLIHCDWVVVVGVGYEGGKKSVGFCRRRRAQMVECADTSSL